MEDFDIFQSIKCFILIWNCIIYWWRRCKWFAIPFISWNAFLWRYTSSCCSCCSIKNRYIISKFFHHYFFWCWWLWLTNQMWCIGYLLCLNIFFRWFIFPEIGATHFSFDSFPLSLDDSESVGASSSSLAMFFTLFLINRCA